MAPIIQGLSSKAAVSRTLTSAYATLVQRDASSASSGCSSNSDSGCPKYQSTNLLPIILGSAIPVLCAIVLLVFLHRRHVRKLRREEMAEDKTLDFGLGPSPMKETKGTSSAGYDIEPHFTQYVLTQNMSNSRESLDSLARALHADNPYKIAASSVSFRDFTPHSPQGSLSADSQTRSDTASLTRAMTSSKLRSSFEVDDDKRALVFSAGEMPVSTPPKGTPESVTEGFTNTNEFEPEEDAVLQDHPSGVTLTSKGQIDDEGTLPSYKPSAPQEFVGNAARVSYYEDTAYDFIDEIYLANTPQDPPSDNFSRTAHLRASLYIQPEEEEKSLDETAEERACRIRSFYKEYFDDQSLLNMAQRRSRLYGDDNVVYDRSAGKYVVPGIGRQVHLQPSQHDYSNYRTSPRQSNHRGRARATSSSRASDPRASYTPSTVSTMSQQLRQPMRQLQPLVTLPPQHALDPIADPLGFAPVKRGYIPGSAAGSDTISIRSQSRTASPSPYRLATSYTDLRDLPQPHQLPHSTTFDSLDFAPPRRIQTSETGSDTGSIRSARTNGSLAAISRGAGRLSRIGDDLVPLGKRSMAEQLRPTWQQRA